MKYIQTIITSFLIILIFSYGYYSESRSKRLEGINARLNTEVETLKNRLDLVEKSSFQLKPESDFKYDVEKATEIEVGRLYERANWKVSLDKISETEFKGKAQTENGNKVYLIVTSQPFGQESGATEAGYYNLPFEVKGRTFFLTSRYGILGPY